MEGAKKKNFDNSVSVNIQRKFDLVFGAVSAKKADSPSLDDSSDFTDDLVFDGDNSMSESAKKEKSSPKIDLDFGSDDGLEFESAGAPAAAAAPAAKSENTGRLAIVPDEDGLEFNLDFGDDSPAAPAAAQPAQASAPQV